MILRSEPEHCRPKLQAQSAVGGQGRLCRKNGTAAASHPYLVFFDRRYCAPGEIYQPTHSTIPVNPVLLSKNSVS